MASERVKLGDKATLVMASHVIFCEISESHGAFKVQLSRLETLQLTVQTVIHSSSSGSFMDEIKDAVAAEGN